MVRVERPDGGMGKPVRVGEADQDALTQAPQAVVGSDPQVALIVLANRPDDFGRHSVFDAEGADGLTLHPVNSPGGAEPASAGVILKNHAHRATVQSIRVRVSPDPLVIK